jgi:hypothetical protein
MRRIMRTGSRRPTARAAALVGLTTLAGCAHYQAENKPLTEFPGIQSQIENFYDANATEDDWVCDSPQMNTIDKSQVVSQSATQVRMAVTYYFQSSVLSPGQGGNLCQGFNTRFFTFDKGPGGQLTLVKMSGPQRGGGA